MNGITLIAAALFSASAQPASVSSSSCINTAKADATVSMTGRLILAVAADDYGTERAYVLRLSKSICVDDGDQFADPALQFSEVQLAGASVAIDQSLRRAVGRRIRVAGKAFAAHTRHHHRPMVVIVDRVRWAKH